MGGTCSSYGGEERCIQGNLRERDHLEDGSSGSGIWGYGLDRAGSWSKEVSNRRKVTGELRKLHCKKV
jgi:hypothetical protein